MVLVFVLQFACSHSLGMARPTSKMFTANSIFLIDTLDKLFLWIGAEVDAAIVEDLLSPEENSPQVFDLLVRGSIDCDLTDFLWF